MKKLLPPLLVILLASLQSWAQTPPAGGNAGSKAKRHYDIGVKTGSLLPYNIVGVRDLLPIWGIKFGHGFSNAISFEYDIDFANAKGVTYYLGYASIRHDFNVLETLPLFVLVGLDYHTYKRKNTVITNTEFPFRSSTGWHLGFGGESRLFGSIWFRMDIRMGFSPGRQMNFTGGLVLRF